jgi:hypothetical protein
MFRTPFVFAVIVLFVNDHFLKKAWPGLVTGKLSDIAGMIFFPLLLTHVICWLVRDARRDRVLLFACLLTAIVFTLTKTTTFANEAYRVTWGAMQWPARAAWALAHGRALPHLARVMLVRDPTDVVAVPFVALSFLTGATRPLRSRSLLPSSLACRFEAHQSLR